jgi:ketosteroid isomerase-like protein
MVRFFLLILLVSLLADRSSAEEIDIVTCDVLPVVEVRVSGLKFHFLVDTAATSLLNIKSFASGKAKTISVTSWSGTADTKAEQVTISDLSVGDNHFHNLVLPAVDLSAIGRACGRQIEGILGIDLLRKLGAVLEFKDRAARLLVDTENAQSRVKELQERIVSCGEALNRGDENAFSDCLDPEVVVFTSAGDFYGRAALMEFYRQRYSSQRRPAQLFIKPRVYHVLGETIWIEYELRTKAGEQTAISRGTALWGKTDGKWRIVHLNSAARPDDTVAITH